MCLLVHDSTGKLTSGILNGNINQIGDFDQCLRINVNYADDNNNDNAIRGQYCLAYMQPTVHFKSTKLKQIMKLIQSHSAFKSEFNDVSLKLNLCCCKILINFIKFIIININLY